MAPFWLGPLIALAIAGPALGCADEPARVSDIYPTASELPENLLRFYVYFTRPMERRGVMTSIELRGEHGGAIPGVFLASRYELWSPDTRRLTLILDPGRVKTGLGSHQRLGRALKAGHRYTLSIGADVLDSGGCPLAEGFEKTFIATDEDRSPPSLDQWRVDLPTAGTRQALTLELDGAFDHLSLAYRLRVKDSQGELIAGAIELAEHETRWLFRPSTPWRPVGHRLAVEPSLEDLAGNRPGRPFDLEVAERLAEQDGSGSPLRSPVPPTDLPLEISFAPIE